MPGMRVMGEEIRNTQRSAAISLPFLCHHVSIATKEEKETRKTVERICMGQTKSLWSERENRPVTCLGAKTAWYCRRFSVRHCATSSRRLRRYNLLGAVIWSMRLSHTKWERKHLVAGSWKRDHGKLPLRKKDTGREGLDIPGGSGWWQAWLNHGV